MLIQRRMLALGTIFLIPAVVVGCGGGSDLEKVDVEDWVADVCDAAIDFDDDFFDSASALDVLEDGDPDEIKDGIEEFKTDGSKAIDAFVKDVEKAGQPDIDGGAEVIKVFQAHAKKQKSILEKFQKDVNKLDDDDDDDFRDDVLDALDDIEDPDFREELEDIDEKDVDDLIDLIDDDSECSSILFN